MTPRGAADRVPPEFIFGRPGTPDAPKDRGERLMRHGAKDAGTSLVEVLVAMALVLVLIVGAAEMMTLALRAKRRGDIAAAVTQAVLDRLETLKARPFDDPALAAGVFEATGPGAPGGFLISETWEIAGESEGLKMVRLRARPAGSPGPETVAVLFISRDLGFRP